MSDSVVCRDAAGRLVQLSDPVGCRGAPGVCRLSRLTSGRVSGRQLERLAASRVVPLRPFPVPAPCTRRPAFSPGSPRGAGPPAVRHDLPQHAPSASAGSGAVTFRPTNSRQRRPVSAAGRPCDSRPRSEAFSPLSRALACRETGCTVRRATVFPPRAACEPAQRGARSLTVRRCVMGRVKQRDGV